MKLIDRLLRGGALAAAIAAGLALLIMMVLISSEVVQRAVFNRSFLFVEEYAGYMVLVVLALGVPLALMDDALLRVDILIDRIRNDRRRWLQVAFDVAGLVFCIVLVYHLTNFAYRSYVRNIFAPTPMMTPIFIPQAIVAIGFALLSVCLLWRVIAGIGGTSPRKTDLLEGIETE